jgi:type IV pilus assembly protein PilV
LHDHDDHPDDTNHDDTMKRPPSAFMRRHSRGVSLIEVLVATLVVALGILAMLAMQVNATRLSKASEYRAMGALLAADLADRMRANPGGVFFETTAGDGTTSTINEYAFSDPYPTTPTTIDDVGTDCTTTACTPDAMAAKDLLEWRHAVADALPGGWVRVGAADTTNHAVDFWLIWVDPDGTSSADSTSECPDDVAAAPAEGETPTTTVTPRCMHFHVNL